MKKISTLALALIAMGSLSMPASAQVNFEPVSSIDASGWYQMRQVKSVQNSAVTSESPKYVFQTKLRAIHGSARQILRSKMLLPLFI